MLASNFVNSNENLIHIIFSYLNVKDLASISATCRNFHKVSGSFNHYWREACNFYFCSTYEENR